MTMRIRPSGIWIVNKKLLTLRYSYGGRERYNLPGGGHEGQETLVDTLIREFYEELGVTISVAHLQFVAETLVQDQHTLHMVFQMASLTGTPHCRRPETSALDVVWIPLVDLTPGMLYPNVTEALQSLFLHALPQPVHLGRIDQPWYG
ncbi:MAG: NUDIX domain-containing protein [Magnetococcales bacterium]|nr:NUDIX domain-containing protein [Magnetococcales bacterium]